MKTAVIDMDGVICEEMPTFERSLAQPIRGARETITRLRNEGYAIIIHTARSWAEYEMTLQWLHEHDIVFDQLVMGKPQATVVIDDRAVTSLGAAAMALLEGDGLCDGKRESSPSGSGACRSGSHRPASAVEASP